MRSRAIDGPMSFAYKVAAEAYSVGIQVKALED
jgi:hypothetical protein